MCCLSENRTPLALVVLAACQLQGKELLPAIGETGVKFNLFFYIKALPLHEGS